MDQFGRRVKGDREMDILQKFSIQALIYKEVELLKPPNRPQRSAGSTSSAPPVNMTKLRAELKKSVSEFNGSQGKFTDMMDIIK